MYNGRCMPAIYEALSALFTQFFYQVQHPDPVTNPLKTEAELSGALADFSKLDTALLTPALAWQLLQQPAFVQALPSRVSDWLVFLDRLASTGLTTSDPSSENDLLMALRVFWLHSFVWLLPQLSQDQSVELTPLYHNTHFGDPRVLVALHQLRSNTPPQRLSSHELNSVYAQAAKSFHPYRLDTPLHLAGWCHGLALALETHSHRTGSDHCLQPFLVNALKACWNDSEQQRLSVQQWLQAMPEDLPQFLAFRQVYAQFIKGRKNLDQIRRTQDQLYGRWQDTEPLKPLIQEALQKLLHQGQVGSIFVFIRHDQSYTPLLVNHIPYAYRQEGGQWCWRSQTHFSQHNPRDQKEKQAHQQLQQSLSWVHQASANPPVGLSGSKTVQSRWWSAGEALLIAALQARSEALSLTELQANADLWWLQDPVLSQVFRDACERVACEQRAGLNVAEAFRACAEQLNDVLYRSPFPMQDRDALMALLMALPLAQVQQALDSLPKDTLSLYLCWARRQTGSIPIDGFCQPLMYENDGRQSVPAVILWGEVHRFPQPHGVLPFISRLHMHEVAPVSDLMRYWASDELLHWRQELNRLQTQQRQQEKDYQRIQKAFEHIRQCREKENLAWAELRNQLDPPELLAYGVASNYALQQAYTRLHRPDQIHTTTDLLCFLADLSTGSQHQSLTQAQETLTQLSLRSPDCLLAELFDYWQQLPLSQQNLTTAQSLFNYCKIIIYDGSQVESQLPGMLSLIQIVHTFHRMAKFTDTLNKKHQRRFAFPLQLQLHWQDHCFDRPAQLHLRRLLKAPQLQRTLMGTPLAQLQDTHTLFPRFALGQEQLALGFMDCLYSLYTTHFSPILQENPQENHQTGQQLWVQNLHLKVWSSSGQRGCELRLVLSGCFSPVARQKIEQLSQAQGVITHDLRRVLQRLRENLDVPAHHPWFIAGPRDALSAGQPFARSVYFYETAGQDKNTTLVVNLPL